MPNAVASTVAWEGNEFNFIDDVIETGGTLTADQARWLRSRYMELFAKHLDVNEQLNKVSKEIGCIQEEVAKYLKQNAKRLL
jgi:predicted NAD/FAD-binding protein